MNNQHVVRVMNHAGMAQRTNSGDLVGMYTLNQMAEILAFHDHLMAAERVAAVPLTNIDAELQTANEEIAYLKQQCEKSNQQGILAAKERDDANGLVERQATNIEELLRDNEALKAQAASAESERDINYRNWQTAQHEVGVATTLYETTLAERNKINGQWYESSAKLRSVTGQHNNLIAAASILQQERDAAILQRDELRGEYANSLRQNEAIASQFAYVNKAWLAACDEIGRVSANYRAAHNEMTRQLQRANDTETDAERLRADVARLTAELVKLGVFVA